MSKARRYWSRHLAAIEAQGVTTKAYAARERLPATSLYYWRRRLKGTASEPSVAPGTESRRFVAVGVDRREPCSGCSVIVADTLRVEVDALPSPQWLAALAEAVR